MKGGKAERRKGEMREGGKEEGKEKGDLLEQEAKRLKELKAKIELAKFVQDTVSAVKSSSEGFEGNFRSFLAEVCSISLKQIL
jgi:hypothetical protein